MAVPFWGRGKLFLLGMIPVALLLAGALAWRILPTDRAVAGPVTDYWLGEYFGFYPPEGIDPRLGTTPQTRPVMTRNDGEIDFDWGRDAPGPGLPADRFSVRWTRTTHFVGGTYRFHAKSDDGIRIYFDDGLKLDRWLDNRGTEQSFDLPVSTGNHKLRVEYYENWGNAAVNVWWEPIPDTKSPRPVGLSQLPTPDDIVQTVATVAASNNFTPGGTQQSGSASQDTAEAPIPRGNLLRNGGFEADSGSDGTADGWMISIPNGQFATVKGQADTPEGQKVAAFQPSQKSFTVSQEVGAEQNESYEFSGYVNVTSEGGWFRLALMLIPLDERGQPLASFDQAIFTEATSGWVEVKKRSTMPSYTKRVRVQIKVDVMRATAFLDDLQLLRAEG